MFKAETAFGTGDSQAAGLKGIVANFAPMVELESSPVIRFRAGGEVVHEVVLAFQEVGCEVDGCLCC